MLRTFEIRAIVGFASLAVLLTGGMVFSIQRSNMAADSQVRRIRDEEEEITLVERLRWNSERMISSGRGYLLAGDPLLLQQFDQATRQFTSTMDELQRGDLSPAGQSLAHEAGEKAADLVRAQQALMDARRQSGQQRGIVQRFEAELLPASDDLKRLLSRLVDDQEATLQANYEEAARERSRLVMRLYVLLAILLVAGVGIGAYFASRLGRSNLRQQEALDTARKAIAARDELMGVAAHDLRNPLGVVTTRAALIRASSDIPQIREYATSIERVAKRMADLITTMLDVTTIEAGTFSVNPEPCEVEALLHDVKEIFEPIATARHIQFERLAGVPGLTVQADRKRMFQVLSNLLDNALKFTGSGGRVTLWAERRDAMVRFGISDTGPGIAREHLGHIFDRFWRPETPVAEGTGLGLFIVKGIVEAHGGRVRVESDPGRGSSFYVALPVAQKIASDKVHSGGATRAG